MREKIFVRRTRQTKDRRSNRQYLICINTFLFNNSTYVDKVVAYLSVSPHLCDNVEPKRQQPDREYRTKWNHFAYQVSNMECNLLHLRCYVILCQSRYDDEHDDANDARVKRQQHQQRQRQRERKYTKSQRRMITTTPANFMVTSTVRVEHRSKKHASPQN